jgi:hypothetical protein
MSTNKLLLAGGALPQMRVCQTLKTAIHRA